MDTTFNVAWSAKKDYGIVPTCGTVTIRHNTGTYRLEVLEPRLEYGNWLSRSKLCSRPFDLYPMDLTTVRQLLWLFHEHNSGGDNIALFNPTSAERLILTRAKLGQCVIPLRGINKIGTFLTRPYMKLLCFF